METDPHVCVQPAPGGETDLLRAAQRQLICLGVQEAGWRGPSAHLSDGAFALSSESLGLELGTVGWALDQKVPDSSRSLDTLGIWPD